jgi:signal transduction histidine kinase
MPVYSEWLSIRRKLPLLISALLCAVVAALSWASYRRLEGALIIAAGDRVMNVAQRLAGMLDDSGKRLRRDLRQLGEDSTVVRFIGTPNAAGRGSVERILNRRKATAPQIAWLELRRADGTRVLAVGDTHPSQPLGGPSPAASDTTSRASWLGALFAIGDTVYFSVVSAILHASSDTLGYVVEYRRLSSAQGADALRGLIGSDAMVLLGDSNGAVWTDLVKRVSGPPMPLRYAAPRRYVARDGALRLGAAAPVPHSPWLVWIELPRRIILSPARQYLLEIAGIALLVIVTGGGGAWLLSRHITAPLLEVMHAARDIASGNHSRRAVVVRHDEFGLLAESFNRMADQVQESQRELEARVAIRTSELKTAIEGLERAQEELVRRERLAILGQLAGGVGHELRNPLGVMTNALYYLGMVLKKAPPDVTEYLDILRSQVALSEKIVGDLLDFARVKQPSREVVSLEQLIAEQLQRVAGMLTVHVATEFPPTLRGVFVDRVQVGQVVLNLLTNAVQAMSGDSPSPSEPGTLSIRGRMLDNGQVELAVSDSGSGIKPEHLDKVFEPLFTTKARGIGLGLAVSRTLARANGGDIQVVSRAGEGATFLVTLPAADSAARAAA